MVRETTLRQVSNWGTEGLRRKKKWPPERLIQCRMVPYMEGMTKIGLSNLHGYSLNIQLIWIKKHCLVMTVQLCFSNPSKTIETMSHGGNPSQSLNHHLTTCFPQMCHFRSTRLLAAKKPVSRKSESMQSWQFKNGRDMELVPCSERESTLTS